MLYLDNCISLLHIPYDVETIIIPILLQIKIFDSLSSILKSRTSENRVLLGLTQLEKIDLTFIWQQNLYPFPVSIHMFEGEILVSTSIGYLTRRGCFTIYSVGTILAF